MTDSGSAGDMLGIVIRWAHAVAAVGWVGGALFYRTVLVPALRGMEPAPRRDLERRIAARFGGLVQVAVVVLLTSGLVLTLGRLASGLPGAAYLEVLAAKIAASLLMFWLAWSLRRRDGPAGPPPGRRALRGAWAQPAQLTLWLGLAVFFLAIVLRALIEGSLAARG